MTASERDKGIIIRADVFDVYEALSVSFREREKRVLHKVSDAAAAPQKAMGAVTRRKNHSLGSFVNWTQIQIG